MICFQNPLLVKMTITEVAGNVLHRVCTCAKERPCGLEFWPVCANEGSV